MIKVKLMLFLDTTRARAIMTIEFNRSLVIFRLLPLASLNADAWDEFSLLRFERRAGG